MKLSPENLTELEALAIAAATCAGEMIQSKVRRDHEVLKKEGGKSLASQVVTAVDLESQELILDQLGDSISTFDLGLLTEESPDDSSRHGHDYFWCIDPLDGTLAFTKGAPGYAVSIALVAGDGSPRIGVVFDPVTSILYHAVHQSGARKNGAPWLPPSPSTESPLTLMIDNSFIEQSRELGFRKKLDDFAESSGFQEVRIIDHAGAVLNACWVVDHAPAFYFKRPKPEPGGGSLWDFAATACLFNELGLPFGNAAGGPLNLNPEGTTFMSRQGVSFASQSSLAAPNHPLI